MSSDFSEVFAALDRLPQVITQGAVAGLDEVAPQIETALLEAARAKIRGVTHATFAGIVVYTAGAGVDSSSVFEQAVEAVRDRNPAHVAVETIDGGGPDELCVVATVPTDYQELLETGEAGDKGFLGTMDNHATALLEGAARGIAGVLV